jgi:hypothetical protein
MKRPKPLNPVAEFFRFVGVMAVFVVLMFAYLRLAINDTVREVPGPTREWAMPGMFEAEGAVTLGCALWDRPTTRPYDADNEDVGVVVLSMRGSNRDYEGVTLLMLVDGPEGSVLVSGSKCGLSVDFRAFPPATKRPAGEPKGGN